MLEDVLPRKYLQGLVLQHRRSPCVAQLPGHGNADEVAVVAGVWLGVVALKSWAPSEMASTSRSAVSQQASLAHA